MDDSKTSRKQRVWTEFKNQEAYREGMGAVVGDQPVFDPRLFDDRSKDGKLKSSRRIKILFPKASSLSNTLSTPTTFPTLLSNGGAAKVSWIRSTCLHTQVSLL